MDSSVATVSAERVAEGREQILDEQEGTRRLRFVKGPVFAQIVLADEINRTPPKTQAALLEAMQGDHVTAAGRTYPLEQPFFVLATQNPIELEGTYPLPEAQLDRFMFNIVMTYLPEDEEVRVVTRTTGLATEAPARVLSGEAILEIQQLVRQVAVADIQALAKPVLRHRIIPNFYAESERVGADQIVDRLLEAVPVPRSGM